MGRRFKFVLAGALILTGMMGSSADLEAWEKKAGVKVGPGDVMLLYTGRYKKRATMGP